MRSENAKLMKMNREFTVCLHVAFEVQMTTMQTARSSSDGSAHRSGGGSDEMEFKMWQLAAAAALALLLGILIGKILL